MNSGSPERARRAALWWAAYAIWLAALWALSSRSLPDVPGPRIPFADKAAHFVWFLGGSLVLGTALRATRPLPRFRFALGLVAAAGLVGALDEWHQASVPGRNGNDPFDWAADLAGGLAAATWMAGRPARARMAGLPGRTTGG